MKKTIGIFDSGVGGLTVLRSLRKFHPHHNYLYLGDTARVPYGTKSKETVIHYSMQDASFLKKEGVDMIIVACHTASAFALKTLKEKFKIPVIGVLETAVEEAIRVSKGEPIGIIGTEGTINSNSYQNAISSKNTKIKVYAKACPLFVPIAEEGLGNDEIASLVAKKYLSYFKNKISTLILACTHYPLLKKVIKKNIAKNIKLVDPADVLSHKILFENDGKVMGGLRICVTDIPQKFAEISKRFLGDDLPKIEKVDIENIR